MNERIRLLWAECVIKHTKDPMNWQTVADEFAELIVRECAKIANRAENTETEIRCMYDVITEHFGVEE